MNNSINSIRQFIGKLSIAAETIYITHQYRVFFKGYRSYVDDMISGVKGRLATLVFTIGSSIGKVKGEYIVYKQNRSQPRTDTHNG